MIEMSRHWLPRSLHFAAGVRAARTPAAPVGMTEKDQVETTQEIQEPTTHPLLKNAKGRPPARWLLEDDACAGIGAGLGLDCEILKAQVGSVEIDANGLAEDGFG
jgi:hypothetical protein